jgi:hypothetical protein
LKEFIVSPFDRWKGAIDITVHSAVTVRFTVRTASLRRLGISRNPSDVRLELGTHQMADELRHLGLGRMMEYRYSPEDQMILSPVLESYTMS